VTRILVHGAGRMARRVVGLLPEIQGFELAGLVSRTKPEGELADDWLASFQGLEAAADLLIDFTLPGGPLLAAKWCKDHDVALLSGTTGLYDEDIDALKSAAQKVPVLWAPNLSHSVALITALVRQAGASLSASANICIEDRHHEHKLDAPSGTALALGDAVLEGRSERREERPDTGTGELQFSSVREGEVIGEHRVRFELPDEVIEIRHKALDRDVFARDTLKAGAWLLKQKPGYYSTSDWLGLMT